MPLRMDNGYKITKLDSVLIYENKELGLGRILVKDYRKPQWEILNETKEISGYKVQNFGKKVDGLV